MPSLLKVRKTLSKKRNAYFVFVPQQACDYLKNYLEWRLGEGETLAQDLRSSLPSGSMTDITPST